MERGTWRRKGQQRRKAEEERARGPWSSALPPHLLLRSPSPPTPSPLSSPGPCWRRRFFPSPFLLRLFLCLPPLLPPPPSPSPLLLVLRLLLSTVRQLRSRRLHLKWRFSSFFFLHCHSLRPGPSLICGFPLPLLPTVSLVLRPPLPRPSRALAPSPALLSRPPTVRGFGAEREEDRGNRRQGRGRQRGSCPLDGHRVLEGADGGKSDGGGLGGQGRGKRRRGTPRGKGQRGGGGQVNGRRAGQRRSRRWSRREASPHELRHSRIQPLLHLQPPLNTTEDTHTT